MPQPDIDRQQPRPSRYAIHSAHKHLRFVKQLLFIRLRPCRRKRKQSSESFQSNKSLKNPPRLGELRPWPKACLSSHPDRG
jgi:hypothetical protein